MSKPKVLITDQIHESAVAILQDVCEIVFEPTLTHEQLLARIGDGIEGLMIRSASQVTKEVFQRAPNLKIVGRAGVGTDNIDLPAATQAGVIVVNSPEGNTIAASEHTIGLIFALARHIAEADKTLKEGHWKRKVLTGIELFGKTLGLIGLGKIGSRVAKAAVTLGMKVIVFDPYVNEKVAAELGVRLVSLDDIWAQSDFITVHVPKTRETTHLINRNTLNRCKPGVRIINCARGGVIDEAALAEAVQSGHVAGVALDVFEQEPPSPDNPLLALGGKAVLTPHLGASTEEAQVNVALDVAEQFKKFFTTGYADNAVNIPLLRKETLDPLREYMPMAETLGRLARQLVDGPVRSIDITAKGTPLAGQNVAPLTLAVLKGVLGVSREGVNYINAPILAEELGIQVQESTTKATEQYTNQIWVTLHGASGRKFSAAATLIAKGIYRIIQVDHYPTLIEPTEHLLVTPHHDRPGMVAKVASVLGRQNINIIAMAVGRRHPSSGGGESLMIFNLDTAPSPELRDEIASIEGIYGAQYVNLG